MSYYGSRAFVCAYSEESNASNPGALEFEIEDALRVSDGKINRDSQSYHTLASDGWPSVCLLGQEVQSIQVDCLRAGTGDSYVGTAGSSTYTKLKKWNDDSYKTNGVGAYKCLVVVQPRGGTAGSANEYQGTAYVVCPENWEEGDKGTDGAQLYNVTYKCLGAPIALTVTHTAASGSTPESWTFTPVT